MLLLSKMAWRNLFRNRRRTGLMLLILATGACSLMLVGGFLDDLMVHMREDFIHTQNGHLQISRPGFADEGSSSPEDFLIDGYSSLASLLAEVEHVETVAPRLKLLGMASGGGASLAVQLIGVDPRAELKMSGYRHTERSNASVEVVEGRALEETDTASVFAGHSLVKTLSMKGGDRLNFLTARKEGALDGRDYAVVGSFRTFMKAFDERTAFVPLKEAQKLIGRPDAVTYALLLLDETARTDRVRARIQRLLSERRLKFDVIPWYEQADYYHQCRSFLDRIFRSVILLMAAIFAFTVSSTMTVAIQERTRELGTMMALGNQRNTILGTLLIEAAALGVLGALLGILAGWGLGALISAIGIPMPPPPQGSAPYEAVIQVSAPLIFKTAGLTIASSLFGALLPAFRGSRKPILEDTIMAPGRS